MSTSTNRYAGLHRDPNGAGDARPTALQVVRDEGLQNMMTDKVMLVTGASSGIGIETVRALHATGACTFMQVRDMKKGEEVMKDILATSDGSGSIELIEMELDSFDSIRAGVREFLEKSGKLNVLVNNAGIRNTPEGKTHDGFETQFGTNHLGHFLLFQLLRPLLLSSTTASFASRVVNVTSGSHRNGPMNFDNLNLIGIYQPRLAYAQSKTANILMSNQIENVYGVQGLHGLAVHPGCIRTRAQRYDDPAEVDAQIRGNPELLKVEKTVEQGAATTVWAAIGQVWEGKGGKYLEDMREGHETENVTLINGGYRNFAFDEQAEKRLWGVSCEMVGERDSDAV